jgi:hypothetical protein
MYHDNFLSLLENSITLPQKYKKETKNPLKYMPIQELQRTLQSFYSQEITAGSNAKIQWTRDLNNIRIVKVDGKPSNNFPDIQKFIDELNQHIDVWSQITTESDNNNFNKDNLKCQVIDSILKNINEENKTFSSFITKLKIGELDNEEDAAEIMLQLEKLNTSTKLSWRKRNYKRREKRKIIRQI